jgi:hypothetical protein
MMVTSEGARDALLNELNADRSYYLRKAKWRELWVDILFYGSMFCAVAGVILSVLSGSPLGKAYPILFEPWMFGLLAAGTGLCQGIRLDSGLREKSNVFFAYSDHLEKLMSRLAHQMRPDFTVDDVSEVAKERDIRKSELGKRLSDINKTRDEKKSSISSPKA